MSQNDYDAIVVGARCAGAPLAMLLARRGYKVLAVDRASFPSDTLSTHVIHPPGVAALARWGLLDRLVATGCPPIDTYRFDFGPFALSGSPGTAEARHAYCPRRTILDQLLVDAAREAGAVVREEFSIEELVVEGGQVTGVRGHGKDGRSVTERARVVIGADGRNSLVAKGVDAARYHERPLRLAAYYTYYSGLAMDGCFETYVLPQRGFAAAPTHDGLTMVVGGWPFAEFEANKHDVDGNFTKVLELVPSFAARLRGAKREARVVGTPVANFFRKPFGPGWALVGDAGYCKDPITAQGIMDAFRDAEELATALDQVWTGARSFDAALGDFQAQRDAHVLPMYEFTCQLAKLEPPPPELQQLLGAVHGNQAATDDFVRLNAGALSPASFFAEANVGKIFAAAAARS